jgi:hypothetical protein
MITLTGSIQTLSLSCAWSVQFVLNIEVLIANRVHTKFAFHHRFYWRGYFFIRYVTGDWLLTVNLKIVMHRYVRQDTYILRCWQDSRGPSVPFPSAAKYAYFPCAQYSNQHCCQTSSFSVGKGSCFPRVKQQGREDCHSQQPVSLRIREYMVILYAKYLLNEVLYYLYFYCTNVMELHI